MKIVCAPDSFKETLTAMQAARAMAAGAARVSGDITCDICPIGDGGEGTMDALLGSLHGSLVKMQVAGPLGEPINAGFGISGDGSIAVVELAKASGLTLVSLNLRDPMRTTTFGAGQLIRAAAERGCKEIIVCIGGSATVDGGAGIAQAMGARFFDRNGVLIETPMNGGMLIEVSRVEPPPPKQSPIIRVACDVTNPLCGPNGAAAIYAPQKGALPRQVNWLDEGLAHLASIVGGDPNVAGAGAAGGAGFGLMALCGARLERGIELVLDAIQFAHRCEGASLVLTGEGRLDAQSLNGKTCMGVAAAAGRLNIPTVAFVGSTGPGWERCIDADRPGFLRDCVSLTDRFGKDRAMREAEATLMQATEDWVREILCA